MTKRAKRRKEPAYGPDRTPPVDVLVDRALGHTVNQSANYGWHRAPLPGEVWGDSPPLYSRRIESALDALTAYATRRHCAAEITYYPGDGTYTVALHLADPIRASDASLPAAICAAILAAAA
jgi:hypothetical protein